LKQRLRDASNEGEPSLFSQSRARQHPPAKISPPVVEAILEIRDEPPDELQRTPGPLAIIYYLQRQERLTGEHIPTSTSTIWRILDQGFCGRGRWPMNRSSARRPMKNGRWTSRT
jgi:hypothetical protein